MSAPPNFDYKSSMLPEVGGTIHVQGGGGYAAVGGAYSPEDIKILTEYGLQDGGIISKVIDDETKKAFLEQLKSEECSSDSGESVILKKKCWAVVAVTRALIKHDLSSGSAEEPATPPASPVVTPDSPVVTPDSPVATPDSPVVTPDSPVVTPASPVAPVAHTLSKSTDSVEKVDNHLKLNTNTEEFYTNVNVKGRPTRIRAKAPANITNKYKAVGGKRKNKTRKAKASKSKLKSRRKYRA